MAFESHFKKTRKGRRTKTGQSHDRTLGSPTKRGFHPTCARISEARDERSSPEHCLTGWLGVGLQFELMISEAALVKIALDALKAAFAKISRRTSKRRYSQLLAGAIAELLHEHPDITSAAAQIAAAELLGQPPSKDLFRAQEILRRTKRRAEACFPDSARYSFVISPKKKKKKKRTSKKASARTKSRKR